MAYEDGQEGMLAAILKPNSSLSLFFSPSAPLSPSSEIKPSWRRFCFFLFFLFLFFHLFVVLGKHLGNR